MLKMKFKSTLKWKYIHHAPTSSSSEDISLQMKEKRNLKISHKNMNVNFKYKDSCSQKSDQDETILSSIKIYKIDKNAALATIIFSLIQYFFIVIKKNENICKHTLQKRHNLSYLFFWFLLWAFRLCFSESVLFFFGASEALLFPVGAGFSEVFLTEKSKMYAKLTQKFSFSQ